MKNGLKFVIAGIISLTSIHAFSQGSIEQGPITHSELEDWLDFLEHACIQDPNCIPIHWNDVPNCAEEGESCEGPSPHEITIIDFGETCHYYIKEYFTDEEGKCVWISHSYSGECYSD